MWYVGSIFASRTKVNPLTKILRQGATCQKSLAEFAARRRQIKCNPFFAGACTWQKILLSLQVWNLFAFSEQIMRAADCKPFAKKGLCPFLTVIKRAVSSRDSPLCMYFDEIAQEEGIKDLRFPPASTRTPPETGHRHRPAASGNSRHRPPSSARPPASAPRRRRLVRR